VDGGQQLLALNIGKVSMIKNIFESLEHAPPDVLKKILKGCIWEGTSDSNTMALTFDDGPDPDVTPAVLDALDEFGGSGTFFMLGDNVKKHPHIARNVFERGHTIGNHSMSHRKMLLMKREEVEFEIGETQKAISDATGKEPVWFRPPYGIFDFTCADVVKKKGLSMVLWTVLSGDYSGVSTEQIFKIAKPFIRPGAIQVFHDTVNGGGIKLKDIIKKIGIIASGKGIRLGNIEHLSLSNSIEINQEDDN